MAIIKVYNNLGQELVFCEAVPRDGRSFSMELFNRALTVLRWEIRKMGKGERERERDRGVVWGERSRDRENIFNFRRINVPPEVSVEFIKVKERVRRYIMAEQNQEKLIDKVSNACM